MTSLLYSRSGRDPRRDQKQTTYRSFNSRFPMFPRKWSSSLQPPLSLFPRRPETITVVNPRPSTRESFRRLLDSIEQSLNFAFRSTETNSVSVVAKSDLKQVKVPIPVAASNLVVILDDADALVEDTKIDRSYSERLGRQKQFAERVSEIQRGRIQKFDEGVFDRIDKLMQDRDREHNNGLRVDDQRSLIARRLESTDTPWTQKATKFLSSGKSSDSVIVIEKYAIPMSERKLQCLRPLTWLNDEVVNYYMALLQDKDNLLCASNSNRRASHFFNSFFISSLLEGGKYTYKNIRRWTKKVDIFSRDKIFFPINIKNTHWTMCVIHMSQRRIQYYDSMAGSGDSYIRALIQYLKDEHMDKKGVPLPDAEEWTLQTCLRQSTPQQHNGSDCGMFSIFFADFLSDDLPLEFDQAHIPALRVKTCASIMAGKLWYCEDLWGNN